MKKEENVPPHINKIDICVNTQTDTLLSIFDNRIE